jgi:hypothetical protein
MALICGLHRSRLGAVALVGALAGVIALAMPPTPRALLIATTTTVAAWLLSYHPAAPTGRSVHDEPLGTGSAVP